MIKIKTFKTLPIQIAPRTFIASQLLNGLFGKLNFAENNVLILECITQVINDEVAVVPGRIVSQILFQKLSAVFDFVVVEHIEVVDDPLAKQTKLLFPQTFKFSTDAAKRDNSLHLHAKRIQWMQAHVSDLLSNRPTHDDDA